MLDLSEQVRALTASIQDAAALAALAVLIVSPPLALFEHRLFPRVPIDGQPIAPTLRLALGGAFAALATAVAAFLILMLLNGDGGCKTAAYVVMGLLLASHAWLTVALLRFTTGYVALLNALTQVGLLLWYLAVRYFS